MQQNINIRDVEKLAAQFESVEQVTKKIKSVQSIKSRLLKQKSREDYEVEYNKITTQENLLQEVRRYMTPKKITVTTMTQEQIAVLTYDETIKAIKSIQSKKCNEQYNDDKTEYNKAIQIEQWLLAHKEDVKPIEDTVVKKSQINDLINELEQLDEKISREYILEQLRKLV